MKTERNARPARAVTARSIGWASLIAVFVIALLRLAGGLLHVTLLTSVESSWIEMKAITMVCFLLSAGALALIYARPASNHRSSGATLLGGVVALVGLATIADYVSHLVVGRAPAMAEARFLSLFFSAHTRMALITAAVFTLVGFALVLLTAGSRRAANVAHALAFPAAAASYVVPLSYLLGVQSMSAVLGTPMALNTGLAFCFLCLAVFCARTDTWLMKSLTGDELGGYMARRLLPAFMATPLVVGWLRLQGERTGLFSSEVGVALVAATYTVVFVVLVLLVARAGNRTDSRRREAEQVTRESEERLSRAQEIAHLGSWQLDPVSNRLTWSDEVYRIFGLKPQEFGATYEAFLAAVHPDDRAAVNAAYTSSVRDNRDGYEIEHRVVRKGTGEVRIVREKCEHFRDSSGRIVRSTGMVHDITERKQADTGLRESEEKFAKAFRSAPYALSLTRSQDGRIIDVNESFCEISGYARDEVVGRVAAEPQIWVNPADRSSVVEELSKTGRVRNKEFQFRVKNGEVVVGLYSAEIIQVANQSAMLSSISDITERKRIEQTLRENEERLERLYSAMSEGLVLHHIVYDGTGKATDYRLVDVNPAFEAITGLSRELAVGQLASKLYGTGTPPYLEIYAKVAETGEPTEFETEFAPMAKCFHISVFSPGKGMFATVFADITERKHAERRLTEQATMLACANDAIVGYDAGFRVTFWNRAAELMYGYGEAEAMGRVGTDLFHPVYVGGVTREQLVERIASAGHVETESIRTTRDGRQISVEAHVIALRDEQGRTTGYVSVDRDITERKRAEQALCEAKENLEVRVRERTAELAAEIDERKRAEERLAATSQYVRSLIESSLDPLVTINAEGRITDVNEATIKVTGATRVELVGTDFSEYFTEPEQAREGYRRAFADGFVADYPLTIRHRDGRLTDVLYNATVYRDTRGNIVGVFAAARDVTDRRRAEALVEAERQRLRDVLNMLPAYVILLAPDHTVPFANRFFEERFGKSLGRRCYDYLFQRREPCENCESFKAMKTNRPHHWEWLGPDGRNYDINDFPFRDVDGSPLIMEVGIDITERKKAEDALHQAHDTLEVKVAERTAELKRSNAELEQFAYVASHDLQQPLRMVASYVELLAQRYKGRLDEKADKYIAYASGGAVRMHQLVNDLLAFSRVGTRAAPLSPVSLDRIAAQARENLTLAIEQSGAKVKIGPLPTVAGDETQLVQLFQNLFDNAIKFRGAAPPEVSVYCRDAGDNWECAVSDNGIGIDPKHAERIFGLFKRLHTEEEYPGTGIGLAVCRKIVERHGGAIYVEPAEGGGAVFRFTLPKQGKVEGEVEVKPGEPVTKNQEPGTKE